MQSSFERIIGGSESFRNEVAEAAERASARSGKELFEEYLVEPTPTEQVAILEAAEHANSIALKYGGKRTISPERVFLLRNNGVRDINEGRIAGGVYNAFNQSIAVDRRNSPALTEVGVFHEALHANSYQSTQVLGEDETTRPYRSGIAMTGREGEGVYFGRAQEAVIAKLSRNFFDEVISKNPLYGEDIRRTEEIKRWLTEFFGRHVKDKEAAQKRKELVEDILILPSSQKLHDVILATDKDDFYKFSYFKGYFDRQQELGDVILDRAEERRELDEALNRMVQESEGKLGTKEDLFEHLVEAHFTGSYLPLARKVEGALGKGSFRRAAIELGDMTE